MAKIAVINNIKDYKKYINCKEETIIYVKDLTHTGIDIYKDYINTSVRLYAGILKKHQSDNWFNFNIIGADAPEIKEFQLPNLKIRSYDKLLQYEDYDINVAEEALNYIQENFTGEYNKMPASPSSIIQKNINIKKLMLTKDKTLIDLSHSAFQPGAVYLKEQYLNTTIPFETHLDIRQAYAAILSNKKFPFDKYIYVEAFKADEKTLAELMNAHLAVIRFIGGKVRLKPHGFPLLQQSQKQKYASIDKTNMSTMNMSRYNVVYNIGDFYGGLTLTTPAIQVLLDNYDIIEPLVMLDGIYWLNSIKGIGQNLIRKLYELRTTTTNPALKNFAKLCNEYCAGMLQRKYTIISKPWHNLQGEKKEGKATKIPLNCIVGDFITDYLRLQISNTLQILPFEWIIGYDTDGIFINQPKEKIMPYCKNILGTQPGTFHFDAEYKDVIHLANKQYYGRTLNGQPFGKLAGIPDGNQVAEKLLAGIKSQDIKSLTYIWNKQLEQYELKERPIKIGGQQNE